MNEIEKRGQVGESDFQRLGFATVSDALQERLDQINSEFFQLSAAVFPAERLDYLLIGP